MRLFKDMNVIRIFCLIFILITSAGKAIGDEKSIKLSNKDLLLPAVLGKQIFDISDKKFQFLVLDFWASWCEPCQKSMPFFEEESRKWKRANVIFVGINMDEDELDARSSLVGKNLDYPMLLDKNHNLSKKIGVEAIPQTFIFDKELHLVKSFRGYTSEKKIEMELEFKRLFKKGSTK
jgi:thiol-disulfide isomerase/thioredoxin